MIPFYFHIFIILYIVSQLSAAVKNMKMYISGRRDSLVVILCLIPYNNLDRKTKYKG